MRYIYVEFVGTDEKGIKQHLVFDRRDYKEKVITQKELDDDVERSDPDAEIFCD